MSATLPLLLAGELTTTSQSHPLTAPHDGRPLGDIALAGDSEIARACEAATECAPRLAAQPAHARVALLRRLQALVARDADALTQAIVAEAGKPVRYASGEVARAQQTLEAAAIVAQTMAGELIPLDGVPAGDGLLAFTKHVPIGPILGISPFNFPLNLMLHKIAPAIAAGCPIIHKPATSVAGVALRFAALVHEAGALPGQVQILPMPGTRAGELARKGSFAAISFTGSPAVGWDLKAQSGARRVTLELGGNAAAILEPDADIDDALNALTEAAFAYAGQVCISLQRLFVHESLAATVRGKLLERVRATKYGDPADREAVVGPIITADDVERLEGQIDAAVSQGATLHTGGTRFGHQGLVPTLLEHVDPLLAIAAEEAFGPVLLLETYTDFNEAIARVNASHYGLQASVYTHDIRRIRQAHAELEVGGVMVNLPPTFRIDAMPYGGVKRSGLGREGLRYAVEEFTEPRLCVVKS